jgi:hypothetical protein
MFSYQLAYRQFTEPEVIQELPLLLDILKLVVSVSYPIQLTFSGTLGGCHHQLWNKMCSNGGRNIAVVAVSRSQGAVNIVNHRVWSYITKGV